MIDGMKSRHYTYRVRDRRRRLKVLSKETMSKPTENHLNGSRGSSSFVLSVVLILSAGAFCGLLHRAANDHYNRGYERQQRGDFEGAIAEYDKALKLDP